MRTVLVIITLILLSSYCYANEDPIPVDKAAHFGVSWAINHTTYVICTKVTNEKTGCLIGSILFTSVIGVVKELTDNNKTSESLKDLSADGLGILGSSLVITIGF